MKRCHLQTAILGLALLAGPVRAEIVANPEPSTSVPPPAPTSITTPAPDSRAGDKEPDFADRAPAKIYAPGENQFFTFNAENDSITSHSDRHYTNGVRFSYFDMRDKPPSFTRALDKWVPFFEENDQTGIVYSVGQNIYTPDDIKIKGPQQGQRPYAGWLYASAGLNTIVDNHVDELELTLGMVGPASLAEQTQKTWHRFVGADKPQGWDNQLENEPGIILAWDRRWPEWNVIDTGNWYIAGEPDIGLTAGNIYTNANAGYSVRFGPSDSRWQDTPVRVRPAMPGTGFFAKPEGWFSWYLFAGVNGRAVARDIFLDGNTFTDSLHVEKKPFVGDLNAGIAATFGRVRVTYTNVYRSKEYEGQPKGDIFGTVNVGYRF